MWIISGMFTLGGWWEMEWRAKAIIVQNGGRAWNPKTSWKGCAGSLMAEMNQIYTVDIWTAKTSSNTNLDTHQCLKPPFKPFISPWIHTCYNQSWVGRLKFRLAMETLLEINSTVVWLYAGGVSLIFPDVWFGTVSQDWSHNTIMWLFL